MKKALKSSLKWAATILAVTVVVIIGNLLTEGVPLRGTPDVEEIEKIQITHADYPDEIKEFTDEWHIELAEVVLSYLNYSPLKGLEDDNQLITITYIMEDGTEYVIAANEKTVWYNGKACAIHDEEMFVKMTTAAFFKQNG